MAGMGFRLPATALAFYGPLTNVANTRACNETNSGNPASSFLSEGPHTAPFEGLPQSGPPVRQHPLRSTVA